MGFSLSSLPLLSSLSSKMGSGKLSQQQRYMLLGGGGLALLLLLQFAIIPAVQYTRSVDKDLARAKRHYESISTLVARLETLRKAETVATRAAAGQKDALFAHVESLARKLKLTRNVDSMRPSSRVVDENTMEDEVQVRMRGLEQEELMRFLYAIEYEENTLSVKTMSMRKDKRNLLDVDITVSLLRPST